MIGEHIHSGKQDFITISTGSTSQLALAPVWHGPYRNISPRRLYSQDSTSRESNNILVQIDTISLSRIVQSLPPAAAKEY